MSDEVSLTFFPLPGTLLFVRRGNAYMWPEEAILVLGLPRRTREQVFIFDSVAKVPGTAFTSHFVPAVAFEALFAGQGRVAECYVYESDEGRYEVLVEGKEPR